MQTSDEELIREVKSGDPRAFELLMNRYVRHIFNFVFQYVHTREEADDVVQDAFLKAWKYMYRFKDGMKFKPWLFTIARNTSLDYIKRKKMIPFSAMDDDTEGLSFTETVADVEPLPSHLFEQAESSALVEGALAQLEPEHRAVLIMHYREELTFEEIAHIMKKPMNTVKSWHHRSLRKLRDTLTKHTE